MNLIFKSLRLFSLACGAFPFLSMYGKNGRSLLLDFKTEMECRCVQTA